MENHLDAATTKRLFALLQKEGFWQSQLSIALFDSSLGLPSPVSPPSQLVELLYSGARLTFGDLKALDLVHEGMMGLLMDVLILGIHSGYRARGILDLEQFDERCVGVTK